MDAASSDILDSLFAAFAQSDSHRRRGRVSRYKRKVKVHLLAAVHMASRQVSQFVCQRESLQPNSTTADQYRRWIGLDVRVQTRMRHARIKYELSEFLRLFR